ncbi:MAG: DUF4331 domain-containing protein [Anaerolineales bacterium]|nr:DUF4331 domain-containing protein [Anaerolineales bacterium]
MIMALTFGLAPVSSNAASHREAPLISMDPTADISDFFMFRSYEAGREDNIVFIMNVIPGEEPSSGPNYYQFDPNVLYAFDVDNNTDGKADDVRFEIKFKNEFRGINKDAGLFLSYVALPPITALDGAGSEGLGMRQSYTVTMVRRGHRKVLASGLFAVPSNVGPRTMPDYEALAAQGLYDLGNGARVFAGQRQDPFYIDLGAVFDTLNLRRYPLPLLTVEEDANDTANPFGVDMLSGFNVHTIALEIPSDWLTKDREGADGTAFPTLGAYASTSRRAVTVLFHEDRVKHEGHWVQIQRLANPLINEAIIGTKDKDRWNRLDPKRENQFLDYYLNPRLALALELVYGVPAAQTNRTDLVDLLLKYQPSDERLSELLRLNISVAPTPFGSQMRLGPLAHDAAGVSTPDAAAWPNGRRPIDDVTDVAVRVIGGPNYVGALAGDGINTDDALLTGAFPFLATPFDGFNRVHQNPVP